MADHVHLLPEEAVNLTVGRFFNGPADRSDAELNALHCQAFDCDECSERLDVASALFQDGFEEVIDNLNTRAIQFILDDVLARMCERYPFEERGAEVECEVATPTTT